MNATAKLSHPGLPNRFSAICQVVENIGDPNGIRTRVSTLKGSRVPFHINGLDCQTIRNRTAETLASRRGLPNFSHSIGATT